MWHGSALIEWGIAFNMRAGSENQASQPAEWNIHHFPGPGGMLVILPRFTYDFFLVSGTICKTYSPAIVRIPSLLKIDLQDALLQDENLGRLS